jgi:hypothetical protein
MARTLAILFYRMLKFGRDYLDRGTEFYEQRQRDQQLQLAQKGLLNSASKSLHYRTIHSAFLESAARQQRNTFYFCVFLEKCCTHLAQQRQWISMKSSFALLADLTPEIVTVDSGIITK